MRGEIIGPCFLFGIVAGLIFAAWYFPRRRRVQEARRTIAQRREAEDANAREVMRGRGPFDSQRFSRDLRASGVTGAHRV